MGRANLKLETFRDVVTKYDAKVSFDGVKLYLEKSNVIDALTKVLVNLYEEPEKPDKPVEFIKRALGGPSQTDYDQLKEENTQLKAEVERLRAKVADSTGGATTS